MAIDRLARRRRLQGKWIRIRAQLVLWIKEGYCGKLIEAKNDEIAAVCRANLDHLLMVGVSCIPLLTHRDPVVRGINSCNILLL